MADRAARRQEVEERLQALESRAETLGARGRRVARRVDDLMQPYTLVVEGSRRMESLFTDNVGFADGGGWAAVKDGTVTALAEDMRWHVAGEAMQEARARVAEWAVAAGRVPSNIQVVARAGGAGRERVPGNFILHFRQSESALHAHHMVAEFCKWR